jgi:hypothetical protein
MLEQGYPAHARSSQGLNPSVALTMHHGTRGMCSMSSRTRCFNAHSIMNIITDRKQWVQFYMYTNLEKLTAHVDVALLKLRRRGWRARLDYNYNRPACGVCRRARLIQCTSGKEGVFSNSLTMYHWLILNFLWWKKIQLRLAAVKLLLLTRYYHDKHWTVIAVLTKTNIYILL